MFLSQEVCGCGGGGGVFFNSTFVFRLSLCLHYYVGLLPCA